MQHACTTPRAPEVMYFGRIKIQHSPAERSFMPRRSASSSMPRMGQAELSPAALQHHEKHLCMKHRWRMSSQPHHLGCCFPTQPLSTCCCPLRELPGITALELYATRTTNLEVHPQGLVARPSKALLTSWLHQAASAQAHKGKQVHQSVLRKLSPGLEEREAWDNS